jgi:hypothetical protein
MVLLLLSTHPKRITNTGTAGKPVEESDRTQHPGFHLPGSKIDLSDWTDGVSHMRESNYSLPGYSKERSLLWVKSYPLRFTFGGLFSAIGEGSKSICLELFEVF